MSIQNPLENPNDIDLKPFLNKKIIFNTMWERDINGVRKLELDAFRCLNSNINNLITISSPIDDTTTKTSVTLFIVRKRLIKLIDIWNRILNSGLFLEARLSTAQVNTYYKIVGSNIRRPVTEYLIKALNISGTYHYPLTLDTSSIFNRIQRFLAAYINNYNWYVVNNTTNTSLFNLTNVGGTSDMMNHINVSFKPTKPETLSIIEELVNIYKELLDETKLVTLPDLGFNLENLSILTSIGRENILKLNAYQSNYKAVAKMDLSYLNQETKDVVQGWVDSNSNNLVKLYPQFGTEIFRNEENEAWNYKNVIVDLASFKNSPTFTNENLGVDQTKFQILSSPNAKKYWIGSLLNMDKPLYFNTQFINWVESNDQPYIMLYNGSTLIHIPEELKTLTNPITILPKSINYGNYTINNNYTVLPTMPVDTNSIEFTLKTDGTTAASAYYKRLLGYTSTQYTAADGLVIFDNEANPPYSLVYAGYAVLAGTNEYKNQTMHIKLENTSTGSNIYKDGILVASKTTKFNFSTTWAIGSTNGNRSVTGVTIENLTYNYTEGNFLEEAPDNQLNLSAMFWKIGTSNQLDPNYNQSDNVKLRLGNQLLNEVDKLDFFDNLSLYLKLNQ